MYLWVSSVEASYWLQLSRLCNKMADRGCHVVPDLSQFKSLSLVTLLVGLNLDTKDKVELLARVEKHLLVSGKAWKSRGTLLVINKKKERPSIHLLSVNVGRPVAQVAGSAEGYGIIFLFRVLSDLHCWRPHLTSTGPCSQSLLRPRFHLFLISSLTSSHWCTYSLQGQHSWPCNHKFCRQNQWCTVGIKQLSTTVSVTPLLISFSVELLWRDLFTLPLQVDSWHKLKCVKPPLYPTPHFLNKLSS